MPGWILLIPRSFLGVIFARAVYPKLMAGAGFKTMLAGFLGQTLQTAHPAYQSFANSLILPHADIFAFLVIGGELYVAIAMLLGFTTRLASLVAMCLLLNYMLAKGMSLWTPASNDAADIVLALIVGLGAAGRLFGVDRFLAERWPRAILW